MTKQQKLELAMAARLVIHADTWERIGASHPSFQDNRLVRDLREAADVLRARGEQKSES